jgi:threonine/homoserine/homoserine lactone efflux protein
MLSVFVRGLALGLAIAAPVGPIGVLCIRRTLAEGRLAGLVSGLGAATADAIYGFIAAFGLTFISSLLISYQDAIRLVGGMFLLYLGVKTLRAPVASSRGFDTPQTATQPTAQAGFDTPQTATQPTAQTGFDTPQTATQPTAQTGFDTPQTATQPTAQTGFDNPQTATQPTAAKPIGGGLLGNYASTLALTLTNPMTILSFAAVFAGLGVGAASGDYASAAILVLGVFLGSALWWLALSGAVSLLRSRMTPRGLRWVNRVSGLIILGFGVAALASLVA